MSKKRKIESPGYSRTVNGSSASPANKHEAITTNRKCDKCDKSDQPSSSSFLTSHSLASSSSDLPAALVAQTPDEEAFRKCALSKKPNSTINLSDQSELSKIEFHSFTASPFRNPLFGNQKLSDAAANSTGLSEALEKSQSSYPLEFDFNASFNQENHHFNSFHLNQSSRSSSLNLPTNTSSSNNCTQSSLLNEDNSTNHSLSNAGGQLEEPSIYDDFIENPENQEGAFDDPLPDLNDEPLDDDDDEPEEDDEDDLNNEDYLNDDEMNDEANDEMNQDEEAMNRSPSNSSFNLSLVDEVPSNLTSANSTDFEYLDLNDQSLNLPKPANLEQWLDMFHNWTHNERLVALESLVDSEICDIQQIRFLLSIIEPQLQRDFISLLPKELALYVLSFLEPKDLLKAAQTCRYWRILCEDNLLWREKCKEYGLSDQDTLSELFRKRAVRNANRNVLTPAVSPVSSPSTSSPSSLQQQQPRPTSNLIFNLTNLSNHLNNKLQTAAAFQRSEYKLAYLRQHAIEHNWRYGRFPNESDNQNTKNANRDAPKGRPLKEILHLKGHDDHVITCLQFNPQSNIIVSGSDDNTLRVWSSVNGRCLQTLSGHTGGVWCSQLSVDNVVISGSTDRSLKIWDALSGECKHTLVGHTSTVRCMALHGNQVVSGSRDRSLRIWDITTGRCCHQLTGHTDAVRCVQFNGEIVVSGAYDFLVKVWDAKTETCLYTLEGHTNRVYSLQFDGKNIVSGSLDTSIKVWSAETGKLKHTLVGHQSLTSGMQLKGSVLVSGNADSTVKIWDINTGDCLQTLAGPNKHLSAVTCLQFNSNFVITSSDDGTVKLWELKNGEFIRNLVSLPSGGSGGVVWRIRASNTKLVCAIGSRNGTEETSLKLIDFDMDDLCDDLDNSLTNT